MCCLSAKSGNILWGAAAAAAIGTFAATAAETKKRRDAKRAAFAEKLKERQKLQAIWDANGRAIWTANQASKAKDDDPYAGMEDWVERQDKMNAVVLAEAPELQEWSSQRKQEQLNAGLMAYYAGRKDGENDYIEPGLMCTVPETFIGPYTPVEIPVPIVTPKWTLGDAYDISCEIADAIDPWSPNPEFSGTNLGWGEAIDQAVIYPGLIGLGAKGLKIVKDSASTAYNFVCQQFEGEGLYHDMLPIDQYVKNAKNTWNQKSTIDKVKFGAIAAVTTIIAIPAIIMLLLIL